MSEIALDSSLDFAAQRSLLLGARSFFRFSSLGHLSGNERQIGWALPSRIWRSVQQGTLCCLNEVGSLHHRAICDFGIQLSFSAGARFH